ncbi:hypothetical protein LCGC14_0998780 [marine sediment metagenome]|uniref:Uncharacterized protein n=1 Tax=marine sediment metagenome TaxID=412755 RepID=A0A0F9N8C3_9ZZZZ
MVQFRTIGGKRWARSTSHTSKRLAKNEAARQRRLGNKARIIPEMQGVTKTVVFSVFVRR